MCQFFRRRPAGRQYPGLEILRLSSESGNAPIRNRIYLPNEGPFRVVFGSVVLRYLQLSQEHENLVAARFILPHVEVESSMNYTNLLQMLLEVEKAIGIESETAIRIRIQDIEALVLDTQKERVEKLRVEHRSFAA